MKASQETDILPRISIISEKELLCRRNKYRDWFTFSYYFYLSAPSITASLFHLLRTLCCMLLVTFISSFVSHPDSKSLSWSISDNAIVSTLPLFEGVRPDREEVEFDTLFREYSSSNGPLFELFLLPAVPDRWDADVDLSETMLRILRKTLSGLILELKYHKEGRLAAKMVNPPSRT